MLVGIESDESPRDALGVVTEVLVAQAFALDRMFYRAAAEALSLDRGAHYHARKALKAQARSRATFKILLALRRAAGAGPKFPDFDERTIQTLKTACIANALEAKEAAAPVPPGPRRMRRTSPAGKRWSPERRARQAAAILAWQPWRKSTGPKTKAGKARSASNARMHGHRSKAYIERRRDDRLTLKDSAHNLAVAKLFLGPRPARCRGMLHRTQTAPESLCLPQHSRAVATERRQPAGIRSRPRETFHRIGIGRAHPALVPFARKFSGNRGLSGLLPADNASPRRRWRIAS